MRTTLELPDPLFRTLKARAAMDGTTLKELMLRFVQIGLNETQRPSSVETMPAAAPARRARSTFPVLVPGTFDIPIASQTHAGINAWLDAEDDARIAAHFTPSTAQASP
jgi:hypothetical protein